MNLNRLPVLLSSTFIRDASVHQFQWVEINYPRIDVKPEDLVRACEMMKLRTRVEKNWQVGNVNTGDDVLLTIYSWCMKFAGFFDLKSSYERFLAFCEKVEHAPIIGRDSYQDHWKIFFEYVFQAVETEYGKVSNLNGSFVEHEIKSCGSDDVYEQYKNLLHRCESSWVTGISSLDKYFLGIWNRFKPTTV